MIRPSLGRDVLMFCLRKRFLKLCIVARSYKVTSVKAQKHLGIYLVQSPGCDAILPAGMDIGRVTFVQRSA